MEPSLAYALVLASLFDRTDRLSVQMGPIRLERGVGPVTAHAVGVGPDGDDGNNPSLDAHTTVLTGDPVATIDALCGRGSLTHTLSGDAAVIHRLGGLARYFALPG